jgi:FkbM family methyltransferase
MKPLEDFSRQKLGKLGRRADCKTCQHTYNAIWRTRRAGQIRARNRAYRAANRDRHLNYNKQWGKDNRKRMNQIVVEWRKRNPEKAATIKAGHRRRRARQRAAAGTAYTPARIEARITLRQTLLLLRGPYESIDHRSRSPAVAATGPRTCPRLHALQHGKRRQMIVIDIGAADNGHESSTARLAERFNPQLIVGLDPHHSLVERVYLHGKTPVTAIRAAAWTRDGEIGYYEESGSSRCSEDPALPQVTCMDLAQVIRDFEATVLKIDAEGAEYTLLPHLIEQGIDRTLALCWVEWHPTSSAKIEHRSAARSKNGSGSSAAWGRFRRRTPRPPLQTAKRPQ